MHSWGGLVIAAFVGGIGWLIVRTARWVGHSRLRYLSASLKSTLIHTSNYPFETPDFVVDNEFREIVAIRLVREVF